LPTTEKADRRLLRKEDIPIKMFNDVRRFLLTSNISRYIFLLNFYRRGMTDPKEDILRGTLDLLVLKTLDTLGPLHGYGIARRIEQVSEDMLHLNQGTLYPALLRLQQRGWITAKWGVSDNNRKARYYALTKSGKKQLAVEAESWDRMVGIIAKLMHNTGGA
jgi:PadR family transcriptional regulator PadR